MTEDHLPEARPEVKSWDERLAAWEKRDAEYLRRLSSEPLSEEEGLADEARDSAIAGRRRQAAIELDEIMLSQGPPDKYYPSEELIDGIIDLVNDPDLGPDVGEEIYRKRNRLKRLVPGEPKERKTKLIRTLETEKMGAASRMLYGRAEKAKEKGDLGNAFSFLKKAYDLKLSYVRSFI